MVAGLRSPCGPPASSQYIGGMVGTGAFCCPVVNRYRKGLTDGLMPPSSTARRLSVLVTCTETPCSTVALPSLLLGSSALRFSWVGQAPGRGGTGAERLRGPPEQMRHIFSGALGVSAPVVQRIPLLWGGCLVRLRPPAPLEQPASPAGHPGSASLRRDSRTGEEGMRVLWGWRAALGAWNQGAAVVRGPLGSGAVMGSLERS